MICPGCGRENEDGHKFCGYCGYRFIYADAQLQPDDSADEEETPNITEEAPIPSGEAVEEIWDSHIGEAERDWEPETKKKGGRGKFVAILAAAIAVIVVIAFVVVIMPGSSGDTESTYERDESLIVSDAGNMTLLDLSSMGYMAADSDDALDVLDDLAGVLNISGADELTLKNESTVSGTAYYRFQQTYNGLTVYGCTVVISADEEGNVQLLTENLAVTENADTEAAVDEDTAIAAAIAYLNSEESDGEAESADSADESDTDAEAELGYYVAEDSDSDEAVLVYAVETGSGTVFVSASTGAVVGESESTDQLTGYNGDGTAEVPIYEEDGTYYLYDTDRGIAVFTWDGDNSDSDSAEFTPVGSENIYFGDTYEEQELEYDIAIEWLGLMQEIYDFYYDNFGEDGFGETFLLYNDGTDAGTNAKGGTWNSHGVLYNYLSIGEDWNEVIAECADVMGHEFTHAITKAVIGTGFPDGKEAAALNEGLADIMGVLIEAAIYGEEPDWTIEFDYGSFNLVGDLFMGDDREAFDPEISDYADITDSTGKYDAGQLLFYAAYLMWEGNLDSDGVQAIDDADLLAELWYRTICLMTSDSTFMDCRVACEAAAAQMLYLDLLTQEQVNAVTAAFDECGIYYCADVSMASSDTLTVTIYDGNGDPTEEYTLTVTDQYGDTVLEASGSSEGSSVQLDLEEGIYKLTVESTLTGIRYPSVSSTITVGSSSMFKFFSDNSESLDVYTTFGTYVYGLIWDYDDATDIVDVDVTAVGTSSVKYSVSSTEDGYTMYLPVGTYEITYSMDGYDTVTITWNVSSGTNMIETVTLKAVSEGSGTEASLLDVYQAYYDKLMQLQDKYGEWQVLEASQDTFWYLEGLCFAVLIDMDEDGLEELVLGYYDEDAETDYGMSGRYTVEVWTYDDQIVCAGTFESVVSNLYSACHMHKIDGVYYLESGAYGTDRGDTVGYYYLSGTEMVLAASHDFAASEYTLYGEPATMDDFYAWWNSYDQVQSYYFLADDDETQDKVTASVDALEDTLKVLRDYLGIQTDDEDADIAASGTCGDDLTWVLDSEGTLTISGTGDMYDYSSNGAWYSDSPMFSYWRSVRSVVIESGVTSIGDYAFFGFMNNTEVEIADTVTSIGSHAFYNHSDLTEVTIPDSVTVIGEEAFGASGLTSVVISDSVTSIGDGAFSQTRMTQIEIPASVTYIGAEVFYLCVYLEDITFKGDAPQFDEEAFDECSATCYYPADNDKWTADVLQKYGGGIKWRSY